MTHALARFKNPALPLLLFLLSSILACGGSESPFGLKSEVVTPADNADALAFAPDGRLFFGEQFTGNIRVIGADGKLQEEPFANVDAANWLNLDWGLTGLAVDPDFQTNHYVYAFFTKLTPSDPNRPIAKPELVRFTDQNGRGVDPTVIIDDFPLTTLDKQGFNANGHIEFGRDGYLYLSLGDYDTAELAQDLSLPVGKLLRVKKDDGAPAVDNPFAGQADADPRIFAYGFRDPFPFTFEPKSGRIYGTDNTPYTCEELNIIERGANYGWHIGEFPYANCRVEGQVQAVHFFAREGMQPGDYLSFVQVSGLGFISGQAYPALGDSLVACEYLTGLLRRLVLAETTNLDQVSQDDVLVKDCKLGLAISPDGTIYYSNEREIRRLMPPKPQ